jgi:predicted cupin superfamily sugar epimerase
MTPEAVIRRLQLQPHPREGGYFREMYRSSLAVPRVALGTQYPGDRSLSTAIYYLITPTTFSAMHRLPGDEVFHHYLGGAVEQLVLLPDNTSQVRVLGSDLENGELPQMVVPANAWQGARLRDGEGFALLGATMAPGFDYADYEHGNRDSLLSQYPSQAELIRLLTT